MRELYSSVRISPFIFIFLFLSSNPIRLANSEKSTLCSNIDAAFKQAAEINGVEACRCFADSPISSSREWRSSVRDSDNIWLGCTRQNMPQVFSALNALNETIISKLWIWDTLISILPADMFNQVRPRILSIERSKLSFFRKGAFSNLGQRLKVLQLRNNILQGINPVMFEDLYRLEVLDLGGNKIDKITNGGLNKLKDLETLILSDNQIAQIEDGAFQSLSNLKTLNLANNKLTNITKDTFRGLDNLETLILQSNNIGNIDWSAFAHMKNLKLLDIGSNQVTRVELRGLESLEKLLVNNNSIQSMKNLTLRDLRSLHVLSLDRNFIKQILDGDLHFLGESPRLTSFSIAANEITKIEPRALEPIHQITILSLQNNKLSSLSSSDGTANVSFLRPLRKLTNLYLSSNTLSHIDESDLSTLTSLKVLALDHNEIEKIHGKSFTSLSVLNRIYLNNNRLLYLPKGTFDALSVDLIDAIDVSENGWRCICGEEWLSDWLDSIKDRNVADGNMGCIAARACDGEISDEEQHSVWITVIASALAVVSLLILVAIGFLYLEDGRQMEKLTNPLRRVPSDLLQLIPNGGSSISLANDIGVEPLLTSSQNSNKTHQHHNHHNQPLVSSLRSTNNNSNKNQILFNTQQSSANNNNAQQYCAEKKRVRFDGI